MSSSGNELRATEPTAVGVKPGSASTTSRVPATVPFERHSSNPVSLVEPLKNRSPWNEVNEAASPIAGPNPSKPPSFWKPALEPVALGTTFQSPLRSCM